jgi:predicted membrane-bound mannosyltransferase
MLRLTAKLKDLFLGLETAATVHILLLLILCGMLYFPYLGNTPFFDKGEPREALAVQDIVQRGEWLFPLKRATAIPSKPPLFHWSAALVATATGKLNETTIRFPSALYATLGVLFVYLLGRKLYGGEVGLLAGAILATTMVYSDQALSARVDMTMCFFVSRFSKSSGLVFRFVRFRRYRHVGQGAARNTFAGTRDRGISRGQAAVGSDREIRLPSRSDCNFTARRRMVWIGDYPRRRRIR